MPKLKRVEQPQRIGEVSLATSVLLEQPADHRRVEVAAVESLLCRYGVSDPLVEFPRQPVLVLRLLRSQFVWQLLR